ncbi:hypothetical protein ONS96_012922 [Cadophora gregata f. sp. sojae]|nr:hypothetical protein ONS96_012922 [Cadophora gregata f. sp. sojae]
MLDNVCIPINLDAFVLNKPSCDTQGSTVLVAPITQPDYVGLRLDSSVIKHDVLPPIDLHASRPAILNPRISKAYSSEPKPVVIQDPAPNFEVNPEGSVIESRLGVYLHWSLSRGYRTGASAAPETERHNPDNGTEASTSPNPTFRLVPNRWLVVRILKEFLPADARIPKVDAWVVESDRLQTIEDLAGDVDLETEVTPFVMYDNKAPKGNLLYSQAEKYIGYRSPSLLTTKYTESDVPRVSLSIMNSSNPVFADYTIHNPNVFSMKDNFEYEKGKYLQHALCDYVVVGWHSSMDDGPLGKNGNRGNLKARLEEFFCKLTVDATAELENNREKTAVISHGMISDVLYDSKQRPKTSADKYAENFTKDVAMEPVSIGVTPLDSVITFLHAHRDDASQEQLLGEGINATATTILEMAELLYEAGTDYDSRVKAADLISGQSFKTTLGGYAWHYDKRKAKNGPPQSPSREEDPVTGLSELDILNRLNELQQQLDITERKLAVSRWALFAEWFKYCTDVNNGIEARRSQYLNRMLDLYGREQTTSDPKIPKSVLKSLLDTKARLTSAIKNIVPDSGTPQIPVKKIGCDTFKMRTDPTICVAGIDSGWPAEFLDAVQIRFDTNTFQPPSNPEITTLLSNLNLPVLSGDIVPTIFKLLCEASDGTKRSQTGHKSWSGQPFCPIFIEWEAMFYNVDASQWAVGLSSSPMSPNNQSQVRYINPKPLHQPFNLSDQDTRAVSGRILVLPQPSFALAAVVKQVLDIAGVDVPTTLQEEVLGKDGKPVLDQEGEKVLSGRLDQARFQAFIRKIEQLKFISGDLTGFTDSLLTLGTGSHVKPNVREQGKGVVALQEAIDLRPKIGLPANRPKLMEEMVSMMDSQTSKTPFGTMHNFEGSKFQPFKGVQHGQLAITKLTIVDKFGQAISCPLPRKAQKIKPNIPDFPINPCVADQLCATVLEDGTLNTVFKTTDARTASNMVLSPFVQITPAINQSARINASFLIKDFDRTGKAMAPPWRVCNDWDNPIFGWIVVNYPDSSLQFFTGDGIFYTSLRFGGPTGTVTGLQWAPFAQPAEPDKLVSQQLVDLINQMQGDDIAKAQEYLRAIWGMINGAIGNMPFPPSQYSAYANAIVGKPLALVNAGWSLELAEPVKTAQHTLGQIPDTGYEQRMMDSYKFPVKIGDMERPFDGVICYWDNPLDNSVKSAGRTDFTKVFTYPFPSSITEPRAESSATDPRVMIEPSTFPTLTPYFIDPTSVDEKKGLLKAKAERLMVKTLLIDPYTSLHLYSAVLPIKTIKLPGWSLEAAMKNMTTFFVLGPLLVTKDVPKFYDTSRPLRADSWLTMQEAFDPMATEEAFPIKLPIAGGKGMWNWLQPYVDSSQPGNGDPIRPRYNALEVGQESGTLRDDPAPYTFIEGFLQLARPLIDRNQVNMSG